MRKDGNINAVIGKAGEEASNPQLSHNGSAQPHTSAYIGLSIDSPFIQK
jgi:hypothetical protein